MTIQLTNLEPLKYFINNVPKGIKQENLESIFMKYGKVHFLNLILSDRDRFYNKLELSIAPYSGNFQYQSIFIGSTKLNLSIRQKLKTYKEDDFTFAFDVDQLYFGNLLKPKGYFKEWELGIEHKINFKIDFDRFRFYIGFTYNGKVYKIIIGFKDIKERLYYNEQGNSIYLILNCKCPPRIFVKDEEQNTDGRGYNFPWKRAIRLEFDKTFKREVSNHPAKLNAENGVQLGHWLSYQLKLDFEKIYDKRMFERELRRCNDYNLIDFPFPSNDIKQLTEHNLPQQIKEYDLPFELNYFIESILSLNLTSRPCITEEFIDLLKGENKFNAISQTFEKIWAEEGFVFDLYSYFKQQFESPSLIKGRCFIPLYNALIKKIMITPTKVYLLPPTMELTNRILRQFKNVKDRFIRVVFCDEDLRPIAGQPEINHDILTRFFYILLFGIQIANRKYSFLAFSSSQLREHSCWFFSETEDIKIKTIRDWMGDFNDIHIVAKYSARMGQCFSGSKDGAKLTVKEIQYIKDIERNGFCFSDGVGKISFQLLNKIGIELNLYTTPSLIQFRMGGYKGVVTLDPSLEGEIVCLRPSQKKFSSKHSTFEVIRISRFSSSHLNRQIIILLSSLGIKDEVFIELQNEMKSELDKMKSTPINAISLLAKHSDEYGFSQSLINLIKGGLFDSPDQYIRNMLELINTYVLTELKNRARIQVPLGALLIGTVDELGILEEDEIFVQYSDPNNLESLKIVKGVCIVARNPCFHPGDIRIVKAVNKLGLKHLIDVVVFPRKGYRDIPSQCSGGDLDGDEFTVIWDPRLIPHGYNEAPMDHLPAKPKYVDKIESKDICGFFINYILNDNLGVIANSHLALSDIKKDGARDSDCIKLAQLHSRAVDFPKIGVPADMDYNLRPKIFPDFMQKDDKPTYQSQKILGRLFRDLELKKFKPHTSTYLNKKLRVEGYRDYIGNAIENKIAYDAAIQSLMFQYGINTELEVVSGYILSHREMVKRRSYNVRVNIMNAMENIKKDFQKQFFKEFKNNEAENISRELTSEIHMKASAWYYVSYDKKINEEIGSKFHTFCWVIVDVLLEIINSQKVNEPKEMNHLFSHQPIISTKINDNAQNHNANSDQFKVGKVYSVAPDQFSSLLK